MAYIVKSGDTLSGIASRNGMTLAQIMALNPQITNPNILRIGQSVNVSGGSGNATGSVEPTITWDQINNLGNRLYGQQGVSWVSTTKPKPATVPVVSVKPNGTPTVKPVTVDPSTSTVPVTTGQPKKIEQKISDFAHGIGVSVSVLGVLGLLAFVVLSKRD